MSYSIYIGNRQGNTVRRTTHPNTPVFPGDDMTGKTNGRHPAYGVMHDWVRTVGLEDLFFQRLMARHPGICDLARSDLDRIAMARREWEARPWPTAERIPGWGESEVYDPTLARLLWFEWWIAWALETCRRPALENR